MTDKQKKSWFSKLFSNEKKDKSQKSIETKKQKSDASSDNDPIIEKETYSNIDKSNIVQTDSNQVIEETPTLEQNKPLKATELTKPHEQEKKGLFKSLFSGLLKTSLNVGVGLSSIFTGKKIDAALFEELEEKLLSSDLGINTTDKLITKLTEQAKISELKDGEALYEILKSEMKNILIDVDKPIDISTKKPFVIFMVGVNGVGKTTTIGKLANQFKSQGKNVMLAAGDTFRAAAVEQLQEWGNRNDIRVVSQYTGSDSASVIYDAYKSAQANNIDVLLADTAGRLQNKDNLMEELKKIVRVIQKLDPSAPHETMIVLDAGTGQNAISQVKLFNQAVNLTGITITKLDGTAKGGVIFSIADQFQIPIRYIGIGEKAEDLQPFNSKNFIEALFTENNYENKN